MTPRIMYTEGIGAANSKVSNRAKRYIRAKVKSEQSTLVTSEIGIGLVELRKTD